MAKKKNFSGLDLSKKRTPSNYRNLLEVRVRRLSSSKTKEQQVEALREISEISDAALSHLDE